VTYHLPIPEKALADCGAILGRRGAGKSGTGRSILETELDAGHRCCVIDPKGDWWGIRLLADGTASPYTIPVLGGAHADIKISDDQGEVIGTMVATSGTSTVIDLSGFSRAGQVRFMRDFAEALFKHNREPLTLMVDEADQLAPQRVSAELAHLLHHMEALIRQGRQRGIFMWMLTQRPQVLNKNLLSQAETLIAMKMTTVHDRKAIHAWMEAHDPEKANKVMADLAHLSVGQAWAWVPGADFLERVQFPMFKTFDSGRTPQHGERVGEVELPKLDVGELAALLQKTDEVDDELAMLRAKLRTVQDEVRDLRERLAAATDAKRRAIAESNAWLELVTDVQDRIGFRVGSARIEAAPIGAVFDDFVMVPGEDGTVRPIARQPDSAPRVRQARAAINRANKEG
jgi:uncharacterized protein